MIVKGVKDITNNMHHHVSIVYYHSLYMVEVYIGLLAFLMKSFEVENCIIYTYFADHMCKWCKQM